MLIIHVLRRKYNVPNVFNEPLKMSNLPKNLSGNDKFDSSEVGYDDVIDVANKKYYLRSVICTNIEKTDINNLSYINIGNYCLIKKLDENKVHVNNDNILYNPYIVNRSSNNPINNYNNTYTSVLDNDFTNMARQNGTLFIYQNPNYLS